MAKSETLSETRQKFEEIALEVFAEGITTKCLDRLPLCPDEYKFRDVQAAWVTFQAGRLQGLEKAASAMCEWCAQGSQAYSYRGKPYFWHAIGSRTAPCTASAIRGKADG